MLITLNNKNFLHFPIPHIFQREYANDFPQQATVNRTILDESLRIAQIALPFIALYKPTRQPLAIGLGSTRVIVLIGQMLDTIASQDLFSGIKKSFEIAIASTALACSIIAHPIGMVISTAHDMLSNIGHFAHAVSEQHYREAGEVGLHITNNALYLGYLCAGSLELSIASLGLHSFLGFYNSYKEFREENYLEGCSHALMAGIHGKEMREAVHTLKSRNEFFRALPPKFQEERERKAIKEHPRLKELIGEKDFTATKTETGYLIETESGAIRADVKYLANDLLGPLNFEIMFHDFEEKKSPAFTSIAMPPIPDSGDQNAVLPLFGEANETN